jgi:hypothetical protein
MDEKTLRRIEKNARFTVVVAVVLVVMLVLFGGSAFAAGSSVAFGSFHELQGFPCPCP